MAKLSNEPLQPNPFLTYRDPDSGLWITVQHNFTKKLEDRTVTNFTESSKNYSCNSG
ncbi:MAG: hypothetical protein N5P05_003304 [Chroococcopsis gigantea SAG 12.99]|nr:hypothetical protein [Chlorogloea purpurea SAG 13.99]MDV3001698.1 hypothetical protein [Chroococcopsis gigantea SAG 12.99]